MAFFIYEFRGSVNVPAAFVKAADVKEGDHCFLISNVSDISFRSRRIFLPGEPYICHSGQGRPLSFSIEIPRDSTV